MKRGRGLILWLALVLAAVVGLSVWQSAQTAPLPYSSFSSRVNGTKALYLILEELGFRVERRTGPGWNEQGVLIALGADYLPEAAEGSRVLSLGSPYHLTNSQIRDSVYDFVLQLHPYKDRPIIFDEYGRTQTVQRAGEAAAAFVFPLWLRLVFLSAVWVTATLLLFYRQRIGPALTPEEARGRMPLEGVYAMAGRLFKAKAYRECAGLYYRHSLRRMKNWDKGAFARAADGAKDERDALAFLADIDRRMEELKNENKGTVADSAK